MSRLGISESVAFFDAGATAHIEKPPDPDGHYSFEGLCGQQLYYCKPESEIKEANAKHHWEQRMCKRCVKERDE